MLNAEPFHLGSAVAGSFGLAGAAGRSGRSARRHLADRKGPELVTRLGTALTTLSFAALCLSPLLSTTGQLWLLASGAIVFDLGVQASLIAHQAIIYSLEPGARSRLNAVLFVGVSYGMAAGSALGSALLAHFGWIAVTGLATLVSLAASRSGSAEPRRAEEPPAAAKRADPSRGPALVRQTRKCFRCCEKSVRVESETDLDRDLEVGKLAFHDVAARLDHFEPLDVLDRLGGGLDRIANGFIRTLRRRTDDFDELIDVIRHGFVLAFRTSKGSPTPADV